MNQYGILNQIIFNHIIKVVKQFDYFNNANILYNDTISFICEHQNTLLYVFHFIAFIHILRHLYNNYNVSSNIELDSITLNNKYLLLNNELDNIKMNIAEIKKLFKNLQNNYNTKQKMIHSIDELVKTGEQLYKNNEEIETTYSNFLNNKLNDIEKIMIDVCYNDHNYLAYDGEQWTMELLKKKAVDMKLPDIHWGGKVVLGYVIRITEQLFKIRDIVEPEYPNYYET